MKTLLLGILLSLALVGCKESKEAVPKTPSAAGDPKAGAAVAEQNCKACHGMDGRGVAPGIPHLAAQREGYLHLALIEYKEVKRTHAALRELAGRLSATELRDVMAYYASQPPVAPTSMTGVQQASLLEKGKALAATCAKCHGEDGNSTTRARLAAGHSRYRHRHQGITGRPRDGDKRYCATRAGSIWRLAMYYASRTPAQRRRRHSAIRRRASRAAMCGGAMAPAG
jgi:cytochrome c553